MDKAQREQFKKDKREKKSGIGRQLRVGRRLLVKLRPGGK